MQPETKVKYAALAVFFVTAWFSIGHNKPDEHFQILEFAQYKLGLIDAADLPWEFNARIRSAIQPWLALIFIKSLHFVHVTNPFTIALIMRLFSALLLWAVIYRLSVALRQKYFHDRMWADLFYYSSFFVWFVPYLCVRFSSENFSTLFLLLALLSLTLDARSYKNLALTGLFLGLSALFRYQLAIPAAGIFLWLLIVAKVPVRRILVSAASFAGMIAFGYMLDYLFYNEAVFTLWNYFKVNLLEGRAAEFSTEPWYFYLLEFLVYGIPPISTVLFIFFVYGAYRLRNDLFVWAIVPYILVHFILSHKELRFMFPAFYPLIFLAVYGMMEFFRARPVKRYLRRLFYVLAGVNAVFLLIVMFKPANEMIGNYRYLYENIDLGKRTIVNVKIENYKLLAGLRITFYAPDSCRTEQVESLDDLSGFLLDNNIDTCFFVYRKFDLDREIAGYHAEKVYSSYPEWIKKLKWIDWQKALDTHSIFLLSRSD